MGHLEKHKPPENSKLDIKFFMLSKVDVQLVFFIQSNPNLMFIENTGLTIEAMMQVLKDFSKQESVWDY